MTNDTNTQTVEDLASLLLETGALMGLDLGTKTIGVAISDIHRKIATARETIKRTKFTADAQRLSDLINENNIAAIVLGLPYNMDGSSGPRVQATRAFARNLAKIVEVPIVFWDERLSTAVVERVLIEADSSRARRADVVDKMAAAYILQGALDRLQSIAGNS